MATELQRRKMDREFDLFDHNCDGILGREGYASVAHKLIKTFKAYPKSPPAKGGIATYEAL